MVNSTVTHLNTFFRFGPTLNAMIYISLISIFTVVALYPDITQHNKIISEICTVYKMFLLKYEEYPISLQKYVYQCFR